MSSSYSSRSNIIIGCTAAVVSSACQSVGLILQRKSYINSNQNNDISLNSHQQSYNRSLWHIGLFLFLFANIFGSSIQITSLPLIVLSPLQSIGLVFNTIFHTILLDEPFTNWSLYGTILISFGAFFTAYTGGSLTEPEYTLSQFVEFLQNENFIILVSIDMFIVVVFGLAIYMIIRQINHNTISHHLDTLEDLLQSLHYKLEFYEEPTNITQVISKWCLVACQLALTYHIKLITALFIHNSNTLWKVNGILFGIISGMLSGFSILLAKSSIEILITAFINRNWKSLNETISYCIVLVFLTLGVSQLYLLNTGLKHISTSVLYPLVFFIYNLISITNSLVFFKQWSQLTYFTLTILIIGSTLVMVGVFLLTIQHIDPDEECDECTEDDPDSLFNSSPITNASPYSPILKSKARYYDSIEARVDSNTPYRDIVSDNDISEEDIANMSNSTDSLTSNQSTTSNSNPNSSLLSNSIGTISQANNTSALNSDILAPFIRRTTENLNNAGRKVSGFLSLKTNLGTNSNTSTVNTSPQFLNHENSDMSIDTTIRRQQDLINAHHNIHEYVSFDSLRDMTSPPNPNTTNHSHAGSIKTINANLSGDYESLLQDYNKKNSDPNISMESSNTVAHGLNILNPIFGKIKKQANLDIPVANTSTNENNSLSKIPSSYKSIAQSIKNFAFDNTTSSANSDTDKSPRIKKKNSIRSNLDDDYNPNNNFNYSFNNTLEEIQHQLNEYEAPVDNIPSPKVRKNTEHGLQDLFEEPYTLNRNGSNETLESPTTVSRVLARNYSTKYRNSEVGNHHHPHPQPRNQSRELRRSTIADIRINNNTRRSITTHKRMLSFEQTELLNDLKNLKNKPI